MKAPLPAPSIDTLAFMFALGDNFGMRLTRLASILMLTAIAPSFVLAQSGPNANVERIVREKFSANPVMAEIARCESKFRQFTDAGNPLFGGMDGAMVGVFQIYYDLHADDAALLGMNLLTLEGNVEYAKHLFEKQGTSPWMSSFSCWGKELNAATEADTPGGLTMNLSVGMEHPQVLLLQKMLNEKGYTVSPDGPGSPGNETQKFGALTRAAVKKFQCATMQICDGDEHTNGYGFVGSKTRAALAGASAAPPQPAAASSGSSDDLSGYSEDDQAKIKALHAQILELTRVLNALLASAR